MKENSEEATKTSTSDCDVGEAALAVYRDGVGEEADEGLGDHW
jgi:hypothetical protein